MGRRSALFVQVASRVCALPLEHVIETMRPLPLERVAQMPPFVAGLALIRALPTMVLDLGALRGSETPLGARWVTLRVGERRVALRVDAVLGVQALQANALQAMPPLLHGASQDVISLIGTHDDQLLLVLRDAWSVPTEPT